MSQSGESDEADRSESALGSGHHVYTVATGVRVSSSDSGCILTEGGWLGAGSNTDGALTDGPPGEGHPTAATAFRRSASFRSRHPVCLWRLRGPVTEVRHDSEHEKAGQPAEHRQFRELHQAY